jgi:hypothetical protein
MYIINSAVGTEPGYGLDYRGVAVRVPVWTASGAYPASYAMFDRGSLPGGSAEINKTWICTSNPPRVFMALCLISKAQELFYLFFCLTAQVVFIFHRM